MKDFIPDFDRWDTAFKYIGKISEKKRLVLIITRYIKK